MFVLGSYLLYHLANVSLLKYLSSVKLGSVVLRSFVLRNRLFVSSGVLLLFVVDLIGYINL